MCFFRASGMLEKFFCVCQVCLKRFFLRVSGMLEKIFLCVSGVLDNKCFFVCQVCLRRNVYFACVRYA